MCYVKSSNKNISTLNPLSNMLPASLSGDSLLPGSHPPISTDPFSLFQDVTFYPNNSQPMQTWFESVSSPTETLSSVSMGEIVKNESSPSSCTMSFGSQMAPSTLTRVSPLQATASQKRKNEEISEELYLKRLKVYSFLETHFISICNRTRKLQQDPDLKKLQECKNWNLTYLNWNKIKMIWLCV